MRAVRDGARAIIEDRGGESAVSFLARRTAIRTMFLDGLLSQDELSIVDGKEIDRAAYVKTCMTWLKYASQLGLQRVAKPADTLTGALAGLRQKAQEAAARTE